MATFRRYSVAVILVAAAMLAACGSPVSSPSAPVGSGTVPMTRPPPAATITPTAELLCPATSPAFVTGEPIPGVQQGGADLVAPTHPIAGLVCRFDLTSGSSTGAQNRSATLDAAAANRLAAATNAGQPVAKGSYSCRSSSGAMDVALIRVTDGTIRRVDYALDGCTWASNGVSRRWISDDTRAQLVALLGAPPTP